MAFMALSLTSLSRFRERCPMSLPLIDPVALFLAVNVRSTLPPCSRARSPPLTWDKDFCFLEFAPSFASFIRRRLAVTLTATLPSFFPQTLPTPIRFPRPFDDLAFFLMSTNFRGTSRQTLLAHFSLLQLLRDVGSAHFSVARKADAPYSSIG